MQTRRECPPCLDMLLLPHNHALSAVWLNRPQGNAGPVHTGRTEALYMEGSLRQARCLRFEPIHSHLNMSQPILLVVWLNRKDQLHEIYANENTTFHPKTNTRKGVWGSASNSGSSVVNRLYDPNAQAKKERELARKKEEEYIKHFTGRPAVTRAASFTSQGSERDEDPFERAYRAAAQREKNLQRKIAEKEDQEKQSQRWG